MTSLADTPVAGLVPEIPGQSIAAAAEIAAKVVPAVARSTFQQVKDKLVLVYAYGLIGFGLTAPFALAAWSAFTQPAGQ